MTDKKNNTKEYNAALSDKKRAFNMVKFALFILFLVGLPLFLYLRYGELLSTFNSSDDIVSLLERDVLTGAFIYLGMQILQIVISIIPSNLVQFAAGYVYGVPIAYILSLAGVVVGTAIVFFVSRLLGRDALSMVLGNKFDSFLERVNSKKGIAFICAIYLIPGLPNDLMCYVGGVSKLKFMPFLLLSLVMRSPGMLMSIIAGYMLRGGNHIELIILLIIIAILTVLGIVFKEKFIDFLDRFYEKLTA